MKKNETQTQRYKTTQTIQGIQGKQLPVGLICILFLFRNNYKTDNKTDKFLVLYIIVKFFVDKKFSLLFPNKKKDLPQFILPLGRFPVPVNKRISISTQINYFL